MIPKICLFLNKTAQWFIAIATACLAMMAILGTADVLSLNFLGIPIPSATEMISAMMPIAIMMAMSYTQITRSHVKVDLFNKHFSPFVLKILDAMSLLAGLLVFGLMSWGAWQLTFNSYAVDERAVAALRFPIWPIKIIFSFGITVCASQIFFDFLLRLSSKAPPKPEIPVT